MSNGHPPICNPECQKIILNGDSLEHSARVTCDMLKRLREDGLKFGNSAKVERAIVDAQKAVFHVQRVAMDEIGYSGELAPWQV
jgi:hypothetical protein